MIVRFRKFFTFERFILALGHKKYRPRPAIARRGILPCNQKRFVSAGQGNARAGRTTPRKLSFSRWKWHDCAQFIRTRHTFVCPRSTEIDAIGVGITPLYTRHMCATVRGHVLAKIGEWFWGAVNDYARSMADP